LVNYEIAVDKTKMHLHLATPFLRGRGTAAIMPPLSGILGMFKDPHFGTAQSRTVFHYVE